VGHKELGGCFGWVAQVAWDAGGAGGELRGHRRLGVGWGVAGTNLEQKSSLSLLY
jgi:hypothetical protein